MSWWNYIFLIIPLFVELKFSYYLRDLCKTIWEIEKICLPNLKMIIIEAFYIDQTLHIDQISSNYNIHFCKEKDSYLCDHKTEVNIPIPFWRACWQIKQDVIRHTRIICRSIIFVKWRFWFKGKVWNSYYSCYCPNATNDFCNFCFPCIEL